MRFSSAAIPLTAVWLWLRHVGTERVLIYYVAFALSIAGGWRKRDEIVCLHTQMLLARFWPWRDRVGCTKNSSAWHDLIPGGKPSSPGAPHQDAKCTHPISTNLPTA